MKWRVLMILTCISVLLVTGYGIYAHMTNLHLVSSVNGQPVLQASGFAVVLSAWPVTLAGVIMGAAVMSPVALMLSAVARNVDHETDLQQLNQKLASAEHRAHNAETRAEARLQWQIRAAEERGQQAKAETASAIQFRQEAEELVRKMTAETEQIRATATQKVEQARNEILDAVRQRRQSEGKAERFQKQRDKLRLEIQKLQGSPEEITDWDKMDRELMDFIKTGQ
ncbi:hypothetical protein NAE50_005038 [Salmonella enterica]|nr:hypothetical protein [Salmonella enterica]ELX2845078.1 hypothetical protein [Salmonella enterica]